MAQRDAPFHGGVPTEGDRLREAIRACWMRLPLIAFFGLFVNLLFLSSPIYLTQVFDRVLGSGHVETLIALTAIVLVALLAMGLLEAFRMMMLNRAARWIEQRMAPELVRASMRLQLEGRRASAQPLRDLQAIKTFIASPAVAALGDVVWVPLFILALWHVHTWFGTLGIAAVSVMVLLTLLSELATRSTLARAAQKSSEAVQRAETIIRNAPTIHAMGMGRDVVGHWHAANEDAARDSTRGADRAVWLSGVSKVVRMFIQILVLATGAYLILRGELTAGAMMACSIVLARALMPIDQLTSGWRGFVAARDAYGRIVRQMDALSQQRERMLLPAPRGELACEDVLYVPHRRAEPVLMGVSFRIAPGSVLGIVGPSGAGKSTLCRILAGILRPTRGHARLDGVDIFEWAPDQLGPHVGYLPQDAEMFEGDIAQLIARMAPAPDPEEVVAAATAAGAHELILGFPDGYQTVLGDGAAQLSGGQRQRLALARALYGRPRLLILDEPNANMDGTGETVLLRAIDAAKAWGATVVIVAHQFGVLRSADRLLVMRAGRIEMFGPRDEVAAALVKGRPQGPGAPVPVTPVRKGPHPVATPPASPDAAGEAVVQRGAAVAMMRPPAATRPQARPGPAAPRNAPPMPAEIVVPPPPAPAQAIGGGHG